MRSNQSRLVVFFVLSFTGSWFFWYLGILQSQKIINTVLTGDIFNYLGTFIPTLTALAITLYTEGKVGLKKLLSRGVKLKFNLMVFLFLILMPVILSLSYILAGVFCDIQVDLPLLKNPGLIIIAFFYILILGGPLGEEFGWRGYALDKLLTRYSPFVSSLILGLIWSLWHIPLFFVNGSAQQGVNFIGYTFVTMLLTIIITVLFIKTNGSVLGVILFHTFSNLSYGLFPIFKSLCGGAIILVLLSVATLIITLFNREILFNLNR